MLLTTGELKKLFTISNDSLEDTIEIKEITTDSRNKSTQSLFIPIIGENLNGHQFVEQAIENGAIAVIWDEKEELPLSIPADFPIFYTDDTTKALQELAAYYRKRVDPIVIGITGSNGKTTTKDLVSSVLKTTYQTHATAGNYNNHIGLPLTILSMPENTEVLVLELGMSDYGEIELLSQIAEPDYALITNIGESHIEYLGSREGIAKAKLEIVSGLKNDGYLLIDGDEPLLKSASNMEKYSQVSIGFNSGNDLQLVKTKIAVDGTRFTTSEDEAFQVPLIGEHHAMNAAFAVQVGRLLKLTQESVQEGLQNLTHTSSRFELLKGFQNSTLVDDSYNASPTSMKGAIEVIKRMEGFTRKIIVLGDVLELGTYAEELHLTVADSIAPPITHLYTYGEHTKLITDKILKQNKVAAKHFDTKEALTLELKENITEDSIVLFKASRGLQFETIIDELSIETNHEEQ